MEGNNLIIQINWVWALGICGTLICIAYFAGTKFSGIEAGIISIKEIIKKIENQMSCQAGDLLEHTKDIAVIKNIYGISNSPVVPNAKGGQLLNDSGFIKIYPEIKNKLFKRMDDLKTRTLYDAELNAYKALSVLVDLPEIDILKSYSVNHPNEPLSLIFGIASWIIRDDYAREKNITE